MFCLPCGIQSPLFQRVGHRIKDILSKLRIWVCTTAKAVTQQKIRPSTDSAEAASRMHYSPEATPTIPPSLFDGTLGTCRDFLLQCMHVFDLRPGMTEKHKILYIVGLLRGRALEWAQAEDLRHPLASRTLTGFLRDLRSVFDLPHDQGTVTQRILQIRQRGESVADYSIRFRTLAAEAGWDEGALKGIFCQGLFAWVQGPPEPMQIGGTHRGPQERERRT